MIPDTKPSIDMPPADLDASGRSRSPLLSFAAITVAFGVCCGLSILASLGVVGAIVGLGAGSWLAVAVASIVVVIGVVRWRRRQACQSAIGTTGERPVFPVAGGQALHDEDELR